LTPCPYPLHNEKTKIKKKSSLSMEIRGKNALKKLEQNTKR
jgi:hypothetical protein